MRIDVLTLFPEMIEAGVRVSLLGKAIQEGILEVVATNIRDFATDRHRTVDDAPYGGGAGMVMKCEPIYAAVESLRERNSLERVILLSPSGRRLDQGIVRELASARDLVLLCARYEGVDERIRADLCTDEISIGDYVLSGGEVAALAVIEAVGRMLPGVVGAWESVATDSFYDGLLGFPQYTRPPEFRGMKVPEVLVSGHHAVIERWRRKQALRFTRERRPDLLVNCNEADKVLLDESEREEAERNRETEQ